MVREAVIDVNALAAKQQVTDQEVSSYYDQNKVRFMTCRTVPRKLYQVDAATMQAPVSDADIQAYYDQHVDRAYQPGAYSLQHYSDQTEDDVRKRYWMR